MKFFIDTANLDQIREAQSLGVLDGVTTNPTLIRRSGGNFEDTIRSIATVCSGPISAEVTGISAPEMVKEGLDLKAKLPENVIIKIPCTPAGLSATRTLADQGIGVNVTLVFSVAQALLASKAGATYVSPFVGRLDDQSVAGLEVVRSISEVYRIHRRETQVLAASIRNVQRAVRSWYNGAEICTMPPKVFEDMYNHILTDKGIEIFEKDWAGIPKVTGF